MCADSAYALAINIENPVFGTKFLAMKQQRMELSRGIQFMPRVMGESLSLPWYFNSDKSVDHITQLPESVLEEKSDSLCYPPTMHEG